MPSTLSSHTPGTGGYNLAGGETNICKWGQEQRDDGRELRMCICYWSQPSARLFSSSTLAVIVAISVSDVSCSPGLSNVDVNHCQGRPNCWCRPLSRPSLLLTLATVMAIFIVDVGYCCGHLCCWHHPSLWLHPWHWPLLRPSPLLTLAIIASITVINADHCCGLFFCNRWPLVWPSSLSTGAIVVADAVVNVNTGTYNHIVVVNTSCT